MKYRTSWLAFAFVVSLTGTAGAQQNSEDSVRAAVNHLFTAMKNSDEDMIRHSFTDSAILQTIVTDKEGKTSARTVAIADFAAAIAKMQVGDADERIKFDVVRIDGPLAIVWAPYSFYYKGQLNHCGMDSFQLLRTAGGWKIQYIIDTRRKDCK